MKWVDLAFINFAINRRIILDTFQIEARVQLRKNQYEVSRRWIAGAVCGAGLQF